MHEDPCHTNQRQGWEEKEGGTPAEDRVACKEGSVWHRTLKDLKVTPGLPHTYEGVFG